MRVAIVETGLLHDFAAVFEHINLSFHFQRNGFFHEAERVQVFGLGTGAQFIAGLADGHVHIKTHVALGHVAIADADRGDDGVQLASECHRFFGIGHIRFRDHFDQRRAGPVQVDAGHAMEVFVQGFPCVFFQMRMVDAHVFLFAAFQLNFHHAGTDNGFG